MMLFEIIKSEGLAHISYLIGSGNEALVIDPRRDYEIYIDLAAQKGMKIKYIFETHRNEDYVIGSIDLADLTGAKIYHGPGLEFKYGEVLKDEQEFTFGNLKLKAIHTPGHTPESMSYVLIDLDSGAEPIMVFSGDALFIGDVGRTDFYGPKEAHRLSESLYNSIFNKLLPLGDGVILCPAHGAGSVCGSGISDREQSTLSLERRQNPILQKTKEDFIKYKVAEQHYTPPYFKKMEDYNLRGPPKLEKLPNPPPLSPKEFQEHIDKDAQVVDTREPTAFGGAHIKGSYSIWLNGLPVYAGWVLPYDKPILLVLGNIKHLDTAVRYLIRLGYENIIGYLCGGIEGCGVESWYNAALPIEHLALLSVQELKSKLDHKEDILVLDVRRRDEWDQGYIEGALHIYVGQLLERLREIPKDKPVAVICNVGHRASLAASILLRERNNEVYNVLGSMTAWQNAGYDIVK
jgi:hydroxyacylglutathione hydrolase